LQRPPAAAVAWAGTIATVSATAIWVCRVGVFGGASY
jgi:hypothetical protein